MSQVRRPFRYGPQALLKKHQWDEKLLAQDAARAGKILADKRARLEQTQARVQAAMAEVRALYQAQEGISLERRAVLQTYLEDQRALAEQQSKEAAQAELVQAQIQLRLQAQRTQVKIIEKHRDRKQAQHAHEDRVGGFKADDEAWLLRRRGGVK